MSRKYLIKNPLLIKLILSYMYSQTKYINKSMHRKWAKEDIDSLAYYFGIDFYWREKLRSK